MGFGWTYCSHILHILACIYTVHAATDYSGHKVIRMIPKTRAHLETIRALRSTDAANKLDFWTEPVALDANVDVRVSPDILEELTNMLAEDYITHSVFIEDVQEAIDRQDDVGVNKVADEKETKPLIKFNKYHRLETIHKYLDELALAYPDFVQVEVIGQSFEGRNLSLVKIGKKSNDSKPAIWIDAGIHAREWIAPATALYIIDQLTNNYDSHAHIVDSIDWYVLPSTNPDGYEFTFTDDRLWRKTRSKSSHGYCKGVDANRNFGYHFNTGGSSKFSCSDIYHGRKALSEPETLAVANFLLKHKESLRMYLSLHSYGQVILTPWAYSYQLPSDYDELYGLMENSSRAVASIEESTTYEIGSVSNLLYIASGSSMDYAKGVAGIKYSYTVELRDTGNHGFLLPASQIIPTGKETWARFKYLAEVIGARSRDDY